MGRQTKREGNPCAIENLIIILIFVIHLIIWFPTLKKVAFYTLGCKLNFSETSTIGRMFERQGYQKVDFADSPDIFIINTCSVTENADKKCKKIVREAKKVSPDSYVVIIGCYAQLKPQEIASIKGVDAVLGAAEKFRLIELLDGFAKAQEAKVLVSEIQEARSFVNSYSIHDRTRTFLKVQDGCNYGCAFCTIPLARGKSRSDTIAHIVDSARQIAETGVKEVVLTGVNIGDFGIRDGKRREKFEDLVRALDQVEGIERFRISSIEPNLLSNSIIEFVSQSERFVPHFHIPLQSGSDSVLIKMGRRYLTGLYRSRVETIKALMPHCCIGVDVIVGFPGETHDHFLETFNFLSSGSDSARGGDLADIHSAITYRYIPLHADKKTVGKQVGKDRNGIHEGQVRSSRDIVQRYMAAEVIRPDVLVEL